MVASVGIVNVDPAGPLVIVTEVGDRLGEIPSTVELLVERAMVPVKPFTPINVIIVVPEAPAVIDMAVGADVTLKSGVGTVTVTLKLWMRGPTDPVTVTV